MTNNNSFPLPCEVSRALRDDSERDRLGELWSALGAAAPRAASSAALSVDDRVEMWLAIASATSDAGGDSRARTTPPRTVPASAAVVPILRARGRARRWPVAVALAASLLLALGLVARPGAWEEVAAPRADITRITLPDGTAVDLDAGSSLRYRRGFLSWGGRARVRQVALQGAAFFSVARDGRPFEVRTYNATVRVLGTAFSVDARVGDSVGTSVEVTEGRVQLQGSDAPAAIVISAGERSMIPHTARGPVEVSAVLLDRVAPWRSGGLIALDVPLDRVVRALERRFNVTISIADTSVALRRVSLYYPASVSLERILSDLATTQELRWERRVNGYVIE